MTQVLLLRLELIYPFELAAYITESNGEWKLKAKLFNGGSEHAVESARVIANDIFVPVVADEEPPFVNIESLGDGKFGINLAKLDAKWCSPTTKIHRSLNTRAGT